MKSRDIPLYQAGIRRLPIGRSIAARALGLVAGGSVKAVVNQANMRLDLGEAIQRGMFLGTYEPEQTEWFRQCLKPGDTMIDVGASFGYYTTLGSMLVGPSGKVFAFEPSPMPAKVIEETITASDIRNVRLIRAAVGRENGQVPLFLPTTRYLHSPSIIESDRSFQPLSVPMIALDLFEGLRGVNKVKLVKIDVEGYEPNVLDGMEQLAKSGRIENIICEFNSGWLRRNSTTPEQLLERFLSLGYHVHMHTVLRQGLVGHRGESFDLQDIWFAFQ